MRLLNKICLWLLLFACLLSVDLYAQDSIRSVVLPLSYVVYEDDYVFQMQYQTPESRALEDYVRREFEIVLAKSKLSIDFSAAGLILGTSIMGLSGVGLIINDTLTGAGLYDNGSPVDQVISATTGIGIAVGIVGMVASLISYGYFNDRYLDVIDQWVRYINVSR